MKSAIAEREAGDAPAERALLQVRWWRAGLAGRWAGLRHDCLTPAVLPTPTALHRLQMGIRCVPCIARGPFVCRPAPPLLSPQEGIRRFPYFWKLHIMLGQLEERLGECPRANIGRRGCPAVLSLPVTP